MKQDRRRWKVCFETNYWGTQKGTDPGEELCLDREFEWNGHRWQIPALYRCRQGLVVDFAMEVPQEELRAFMKKWGIAEDGECTRTLTRAEERQMEQENPLDGGFCAELVLNGMRLRPSNGCGVGYLPGMLPGTMRRQNFCSTMDWRKRKSGGSGGTAIRGQRKAGEAAQNGSARWKYKWKQSWNSIGASVSGPLWWGNR